MDASRLDCTLPMPLIDDCEMVLDEIRRGHGLLLKLRDLTDEFPLNASAAGSWIVCVRDLVDEVLGSLTEALYMLTSTKPSEETQLFGFMSSHGSRTNPTCGRNDRKRLTGGKRTRRYLQYETKLTKKPHEDDGYVWNKYGQKKIFGARHRRCYYKCSQKTDQCCPATKQVQRSNDEPSMFVVTYIGKHCCQPTIYLSADESTAHDRTSDRPFSITYRKSVNPNYPPMTDSAHHPFPFTNALLENSKNDDPSMFAVTYIRKHCCQPTIYLSADESTAQGRPSDHPFSISFGKSVNPNYPPVTDSALPFTNTLLQHSKNRPAIPQNDIVVYPTEDLKFESPESCWGNGSNICSLNTAAGDNLFGDADGFDFKSFLSQNEDLELLLFNSSCRD